MFIIILLFYFYICRCSKPIQQNYIYVHMIYIYTTRQDDNSENLLAKKNILSYTQGTYGEIGKNCALIFHFDSAKKNYRNQPMI
ncbi:hypothetical protein AAHE18_18G017600 [Arachis hypogaea]